MTPRLKMTQGVMTPLIWKRESVYRLFRLDHASRLEQLEAAFAALGQAVSVSVHAAA
jgi:antitoxin HicB